jgi:hypothetical protein
VAHQAAGLDSPTADASVRAVWAGIRRRHGVAPRRVQAIRTQLITRMVAPLSYGWPPHLRDRALLLIGFARALRRSELVALDVDDITEDDHGLRRSKTDQEGESHITGILYGSNPATCPVRAWRAWRPHLASWTPRRGPSSAIPRDQPSEPARTAASAHGG